MPILGERILNAVQTSNQWQWERSIGGTDTSDCLTALVPKNRNRDISINLLVGHSSGLQLIKGLATVRFREPQLLQSRESHIPRVLGLSPPLTDLGSPNAVEYSC